MLSDNYTRWIFTSTASFMQLRSYIAVRLHKTSKINYVKQPLNCESGQFIIPLLYACEQSRQQRHCTRARFARCLDFSWSPDRSIRPIKRAAIVSAVLLLYGRTRIRGEIASARFPNICSMIVHLELLFTNSGSSRLRLSSPFVQRTWSISSPCAF